MVVEGDASTDVGAEVPSSLLSELNPQHCSPCLPARVILLGPWPGADSHLLILRQRCLAEKPGLQTGGTGGCLVVWAWGPLS